MIVSESEPVTIVGSADIGPDDLNIVLRIAPIVVAADGGADHLLAADVQPAAVIGDLDSISDRAHVAFDGVLHHVKTQDTTDFEKVVQHVDAPVLIGVGFLGGRLDHTMSALNVMARHAERDILLLGEADVVFVLRDQAIDLNLPTGSGVALIPVDNCIATTHGLQWDMEQAELAMTGLISSSNRSVAENVQIKIAGTAAITVARAALAGVMSAFLGE